MTSRSLNTELRSRFGLTPGATAAITTVVAVGIATSLMSPLVALTLASRGFSERTIGLVVSTYAVAMLLATPYTTKIAARFGTANAIAVLTVTAAIAIPLVWIIESAFGLIPVMLVFGACVALCYTLSEYWIAAATPDSRRGMVFGFYATILSVGYAIGPAIIVLLGADSIYPFLVGSALMIVAAVPPMIARSVSPDFSEPPHRNFFRFLFAVPVATLGVFAFAAGEVAGFAFLPLWGGHLGYSPGTALLLVSAMTLGNVAFQVPLGALSDRMDRRIILLGCALVGAGGMLGAWAVAETPAALVFVLFVWGGATAGLYTVGLAHLASRFSGADLAGANAAFVFCYALGMLVGPPAVGDAVTRAPDHGFPVVLGVLFGLYAVVVLASLARGRLP